MFIKLIHQLVKKALLYDGVQVLVGGRLVHRRFGLTVKTGCCFGERVLDVGGGTGPMKRLCPHDCLYICLDNELAKLKRFRAEHSTGYAVLADAAEASIASGSIDVVIMANVTHHLTDPALEQVLREAVRVLRRGGRLLLLDAVRSQRLPSRLLWRLDRGAHPRTPEALLASISRHFRVARYERFSVLHEYLICIGHPEEIALLALFYAYLSFRFTAAFYTGQWIS